jgi:hypothetical protein
VKSGQSGPTILFDRKILSVDGFCKQGGRRTTPYKKGSPDNPKFRLLFLPKMTLEKMKAWIEENHIDPEDFCFTLDNRPTRRKLAETASYRALQTAGFIPFPKKQPLAGRETGRRKQSRVKLTPPDGRKLVPNSLRYTLRVPNAAGIDGGGYPFHIKKGA